MIETHLSRIREDDRYHHALIYVYIEANLSFVTARDIGRICSQPQFFPVVVKSFDSTKDERDGVWTGEAEKQMYTSEMKRALADGALSYADNFLSQTENVQAEVQAQLEVFRRDVKLTEGCTKPKITYTGKSNGRKDDLCLVLQMLLYWSRVQRESAEYLTAAASNGWRT